ncbi:MAG: acyl-CoA dehydrogenase family protein, partial [Bacteroidia bacterium]
LVGMRGEAACTEQLAMMRVYINDACDKISVYGKEALNSFAEGDELRMMLMGLKRFTKQQPFNAKAARQIIAEKLIAANKYCF